MLFFIFLLFFFLKLNNLIPFHFLLLLQKKRIMTFEQEIIVKLTNYFLSNYQLTISNESFQLSPTKAEFKGDYTLVCFPFVQKLKKSPDAIANELGNYLAENISYITEFNVIKGFLNLSFDKKSWIQFVQNNYNSQEYGFSKNENSKNIVLEYSSPNTNKPLHLGHIRNNLLGFSLSRILLSQGYNVTRTNLVNDRGIHICKSMLAWLRFGNNETPDSSGLKGDHLIGKYYVRFDQEYKKEIQQMVDSGIEKEIAEKQAPILLDAQNMLRQWEDGNSDVLRIWKMMNEWVYKGFAVTYKRLGIEFDKIYYESETYKLGKEIVDKGLQVGVFQQKEDNSIWIDLTADGLDEKLLLRSDGTSVYITQDMGTALLRAEAYNPDKMIYVVGNEQIYHFDVLKLILEKKLQYDWGKSIYHMSYGMVELPSGKMKSREGTVVDADNLMDDMVTIAENMTNELGKIEQFDDDEKTKLFEMIGLGALKYFILKVDPKKNMMFDPEKSIDFNGNTASFIQYTHARISSIIRKAAELNIDHNSMDNVDSISDLELDLVKNMYQFPALVREAANNYSPALIANFAYEFAKKFNQFYHDVPILKEPNGEFVKFRLKLCQMSAQIIKNSMWLLGIDVPERM